MTKLHFSSLQHVTNSAKYQINRSRSVISQSLQATIHQESLEKFLPKFKPFQWRKCNSKCRLRNGGHFVAASVYFSDAYIEGNVWKWWWLRQFRNKTVWATIGTSIVIIVRHCVFSVLNLHGHHHMDFQLVPDWPRLQTDGTVRVIDTCRIIYMSSMISHNSSISFVVYLLINISMHHCCNIFVCIGH